MSNKKSKLIIGISSRALFNLDESHEIYKKQGLKSYQDYQIENEDNTLAPGEAFNLVEKILKINDLYESSDRVEVILLSFIENCKAAAPISTLYFLQTFSISLAGASFSSVTS